MGSAEFKSFFGIEGGVNATVNDIGPTSASVAAYFVAAERVASVDPNADDIAFVDRCGIEKGEGFIDEDGVAERLRCSAG
jgi:hypothetical protein